MKFKKPTRDDFEDYLICIYFGSGEYLDECIGRAYRDLNRTLWGIASLKYKKELDEKAVNTIKELFKSIKSQRFSNNNGFDKWHKKVCNKLVSLYKKFGYSKFTIGHAQKWINMTFKYIFTLGSERLPGYFKHYRFCHAPIDNYLLKQFKDFDPPKLTDTWSKLTNYTEYLNLQKWIRERFKGSSPLSVEFQLWMRDE